ncbi:MAG: fused MFS/spermidine synthase [Alphaproteobacteria bacterium]|nr:fused MFS/spermidine synthase [Alphaproteobacteria bacterium]
MNRSANSLLLLTIIVLEGYVVLSTELLAIRLTIPFVGSGTDTVSIIIAAVLMPLAFGYYAGGQFRPRRFGKHFLTIRKKLVLNIVISMGILLVGLSYPLLRSFFPVLAQSGIDGRLAQTAVYAALFLATPVYLLGQTIPLISNFFSKDELSRITGRILFFSTLGSFMGATVSTLVLMSTIGVHYTAAVNFGILTLLAFLLSKKKTGELPLFALLIAIIATLLNSGTVLRSLHVVKDNRYNTIAVYEHDGERYLTINHNNSSLYTNAGRKHPYIHFIENNILKDVWNRVPPKNILVIGAGGFTLGFEDRTNSYDYVDIDGDLKEIAETYILKEPLLPNKHFHAVPARAFLTQKGKNYDLIVLDAFLGRTTMPEHLITREFFEQVKARLNTHGIVVANFITSPGFVTPFSRHIDNTFRSVFPHISRHVIGENYMPWDTNPNIMANIMYIYNDQPGADASKIYTDDKNTAYMDKPQRH